MPPRMPVDRVVRFEAHSRASAQMTRAGMPHFSAAHSGVRATPSFSPSTFFLNSSKPTVRAAMYSLS